MDIWISINFCQLNCFRNNAVLHRWRHLATKTLRIFYLPVFPTSRFISKKINKNGKKWNFSCLSTFCLHAPRKVSGGGVTLNPRENCFDLFHRISQFYKRKVNYSPNVMANIQLLLLFYPSLFVFCFPIKIKPRLCPAFVQVLYTVCAE